MGGFPRDTGAKIDPQIEAFANYRDNMHKNFRFDRRNIFGTIVFAIILPTFFFLKSKQVYLNALGETEDKNHRMINMFSIFPKRKIPKEEDF
jgi:hypothetical protein